MDPFGSFRDPDRQLLEMVSKSGSGEDALR
jgi:hypothetical protein